MNQKGAVHLLVLLLVLAVVLLAALFLLANYVQLPAPLEEALRPLQRSDIPLKPDYKNPLDKESQYTNPFSESKNPFDALK